jgi:hypothetical protein
VFKNEKTNADRLCGIPSLLLDEYQLLQPGLHVPGHKVDHSPLFSAEVMSECTHRDLGRDNVTFYVTHIGRILKILYLVHKHLENVVNKG